MCAFCLCSCVNASVGIVVHVWWCRRRSRRHRWMELITTSFIVSVLKHQQTNFVLRNSYTRSTYARKQSIYIHSAASSLEIVEHKPLGSRFREARITFFFFFFLCFCSFCQVRIKYEQPNNIENKRTPFFLLNHQQTNKQTMTRGHL